MDFILVVRMSLPFNLRPFNLTSLSGETLKTSGLAIYPRFLSFLGKLLTVAAVVGLQALGHAQATVGIQPLGSYANSGTDLISQSSLGVHIDIPLFQHRARGNGMGTTVHMIYDSAYTGDSNNIYAGSSEASGADLGWRVVLGTATPASVNVNRTSEQYDSYPCTLLSKTGKSVVGQV
jgi:hypothetical protein